MSIKRLFDAVERRGDIGRRVAALVLPISNRARVTTSCAGKIGLREPGEHTRGPNLASRDNVAHNQNLYTILETCHRPTNDHGLPFNIAGLMQSPGGTRGQKGSGRPTAAVANHRYRVLPRPGYGVGQYQEVAV
jgi:hypothetical protein